MNGNKYITTSSHSCGMCGVPIEPKRTLTGKCKGAIYYTKLCTDCLPKHRVAMGMKNVQKIDYDSFRKHWNKRCATCGKQFDVRGNRNAGKVKTCSEKCENARHRANAIERDFAHKNLAPNVHKAWRKTFNRPQSADGAKCGPNHARSISVVLKSPDGNVYHVTNVTNFVRENEDLFSQEDTTWKPAKKKSKVKDAGYMPSTSRGCMKCRASSGLLCICSGHRGSWKSWTVLERIP